jgi:hypothetical protein
VPLADAPLRGALPNVITIGAMKCGTTSLHYYLDQHPQIAMSRRKELDFFSTSWEKGLDWYAEQFDAGAPVRGESSPSYTSYPKNPHVAERMHSVVPEVKLIYLVRDPLERIVSHYLHNYSTGGERRPIEDVLADPSGYRYVAGSKYFMQLDKYLAFFPRTSILIVTQEELFYERAGTMRQVFEFLDVEPSFYDARFERLRHRTSDRRRKTRVGTSLAAVAGGVRLPDWLSFQVQRFLPYPLSRRMQRPALRGAVRERLVAELADDANRLRELTGKELSSWPV